MASPGPASVATAQLSLQFKRFSGKPDQNPEAFTRQLRYAKAVHGWSDLHALYYAGMHLDGKAAEWFSNQDFYKWEEFERALLERFGIDPTKMLTLLEKRRQGPSESVRDFADSLRTLARYSAKGRGNNDALLLHFFMKGLRDEPREFVLIRRPSTFEEAVAEGEYYEDQFTSSNRVKSTFMHGVNKVDTPPQSPQHPASRNLRKGREDDAVAELTRQMGRLTIQLAQAQRVPRGHLSDTRDVRRYQCGQQGHTARECPRSLRPSTHQGADALHYFELNSNEEMERNEPPAAYYYDHEAYAAEKRARDNAALDSQAPPARRYRPVQFDPEQLPDAPRNWPAGNLGTTNTGPRPLVPNTFPQTAARPAPAAQRAAPNIQDTAANARAAATRTPARQMAAPTLSPLSNYNVLAQLDHTIARISMSELLRTSPVCRRQLRGYLDNTEATMAPQNRRSSAVNAPAGKVNYYESTVENQGVYYDGQVDYFATEPSNNHAMHAEAHNTGVYDAYAPTEPARQPGRPSVVRVPCWVHGIPIVAVVDSGASTSVMSQGVARKLQHLHRLEETNASFLTASGQPEKPWGILRDVPVQVGKLELSMDIPVVAARNYDLLLGNDWLIQSHCTLCWPTRKLRIMVTPNYYDEIDFDVDGSLKAPAPLHYMQTVQELPHKTILTNNGWTGKYGKASRIPKNPNERPSYDYDIVRYDDECPSCKPPASKQEAGTVCMMDTDACTNKDVNNKVSKMTTVSLPANCIDPCLRQCNTPREREIASLGTPIVLARDDCGSVQVGQEFTYPGGLYLPYYATKECKPPTMVDQASIGAQLCSHYASMYMQGPQVGVPQTVTRAATTTAAACPPPTVEVYALHEELTDTMPHDALSDLPESPPRSDIDNANVQEEQGPAGADSGNSLQIDNSEGETARLATLDITQDEPVIRFLSSGEYPGGATHAERNRIRRKARLYEVINGTIHKKFGPDAESKPIPPVDRRLTIVREYHDRLGHLGQKKTIDLVSHHYRWRGLGRDVRDFVAACEQCQRSERTFVEQTELKPIPVNALGERISVGILSLPKSYPLGNKHVLTCVEHASGHIFAFPIPDGTGPVVASKLSLLFSWIGMPNILQTDQGGPFISAAVQTLLQRYGIKHRLSSAYHPNANDKCEKANSSIISSLRRQCSGKDPTMWEMFLAETVLALNNSRSDSTKIEPSRVLMGRLARLPAYAELTKKEAEALASDGDDSEPLEAPLQPTESELEQQPARHQAVVERVLTNLKEAQGRQKKYYDQRHAPAQARHTLQVGGMVLCAAKPRQDKLEDKSDGPFMLVGYTTPEERVCILRDRTGQEWQVNRDFVRPFRRSTTSRQDPGPSKVNKEGPRLRAPVAPRRPNPSPGLSSQRTLSEKHEVQVSEPLPSQIDLVSSEEEKESGSPESQNIAVAPPPRRSTRPRKPRRESPEPSDDWDKLAVRMHSKTKRRPTGNNKHVKKTSTKPTRKPAQSRSPHPSASQPRVPERTPGKT
jgi:hypothetical protein